MHARDNVRQAQELTFVIGHVNTRCIFESSQLEGSYVGDLLYRHTHTQFSEGDCLCWLTWASGVDSGARWWVGAGVVEIRVGM